ncbi:hypothetical protein GCM10027614_65220 [Micromonospora vulcania]
MVRIAGLKRRLSAGLPVRGGDRLPLRTQLELIAERTAALGARHAACFVDDVLPKLADEGIRILRWGELGDPERERLRTYFREHIFPVLTPLAVDPAHPFPYISGRSLNLAVAVRDPDGGSELFARVKVPNNVPRFVRVDRDQPGVRMLPVEDLISVHLGQLFSGMQVVECHLFRVTRNAEVEVDEDRDEDLLQALERELARRRFGPPVRLEVAASISDHMLELLVRELDMDDQDVLRIPGLLDLSALWQVYGEADRPDLKDPPFVPATHPRLAEGEVPRSVFATLRDGDILVHHPYHSFATSVQRFIEQAAADPNVLAIKQTLYRTSGDSPIVDALVDAAAAGKQVVVLVEVKARFDEVANIGWARTLERAGCHVVYGLVGLKTHCKTALVVRQEGNQIRRYCHIGTGNYHPKTARLYEDFGMLTADPEIGADLTDLFNVLTGYSRQTAYRRLMVAPQGIRSGLIERIEREISHVRLGMPGLVQFKVNSLVDEGDRRAVPGLAGRCARRPDHPGHVHAAPGGAGAVGEHPGPFDPRPVPGALPDLPVRQQRRGRVLDGLGRPDAPQPGPAGRGTGAGERSGGPRRTGPRADPGDEPGGGRLRAERRRLLDPAYRRRRRDHGPSPGTVAAPRRWHRRLTGRRHSLTSWSRRNRSTRWTPRTCCRTWPPHRRPVAGSGRCRR